MKWLKIRNYARFHIPDLGIKSEHKYREYKADDLRKCLIQHTYPDTVQIFVTEPRMKLLYPKQVDILISLWKSNIKKAKQITYGFEGSAYRFLGLIRGDTELSNIAMGISWVNRIANWAYSASIDFGAGEMVQESDLYRLQGSHVLNFFIYYNKDKTGITWVEPQTGEVLIKLDKFKPKLMVL